MGMTIDESIDYLSNENTRLKLSANDKDAIDRIISAYLITKANYNEQLKADMNAMLKDVVQNIEEVRTAPSIISDDNVQNLCKDIISLIQDKANSYLLTTDSQKSLYCG